MILSGCSSAPVSPRNIASMGSDGSVDTKEGSRFILLSATIKNPPQKRAFTQKDAVDGISEAKKYVLNSCSEKRGNLAGEPVSYSDGYNHTTFIAQMCQF